MPVFFPQKFPLSPSLLASLIAAYLTKPFCRLIRHNAYGHCDWSDLDRTADASSCYSHNPEYNPSVLIVDDGKVNEEKKKCSTLFVHMATQQSVHDGKATMVLPSSMSEFAKIAIDG